MDNQNETITAYFYELNRSFFMERDKGLAKLDLAAPIGYGQTISQPTLVLKMTLALDIQPNSRILEIGTGSGYQTALLAPFCQRVYTVERLEPLLEKAKQRLKVMEFDNIEFKHGDGSLGWQEKAPFDRIIVTAAAAEVPVELLNQLGADGKLIIPIGRDRWQKLLLIEKSANEALTTTVLEKVAFVRLKGKYE